MRSRSSRRSSPFVAALGAGLLLTACGDAGESPTTSSGPTATADATGTATALASDTPVPTPSPTAGLLEPSAYGSRATVVVDSLRVRRTAGLADDVTARLERGTEVRLLEGPVTADGYRWYFISYGASIEMRYPAEEAGWVAEVAIDASGGATGDPFLDIDAPACPGSVDAALLAGLSLYAIDVCDVQVAKLHRLIDTCIEGPITPFTYEPGWVWFSCPFLRDDEPDSSTASGSTGWRSRRTWSSRSAATS